MDATWLREDILVLDGALSNEELSQLASMADSAIFGEQELGRVIGGHRARSRAVCESGEVAVLLWEHLALHVKPLTKWFDGRPGAPNVNPPLTSWTPSGCNQRTRFYRYSLGANFSEHEDEPWKPHPYERSFLTVLVYLPTGELCVGGETVVDGIVVQALPNRIAVFPHGLLHEGRPVEKGEKLVLRNDVLAMALPHNQNLKAWVDAGYDADEVAAFAIASGTRPVEVMKFMKLEMGISLGEGKLIVDRQLPHATQKANARLRAIADFTLTTLTNSTEEEIDQIEADTSVSLKIGALVDAGRHEDIERIRNRFETERGSFPQLTHEEARQLLEHDLASHDYQTELEIRDAGTYDFGWTFHWNSADYLRTGEIGAALVGHGSVIVDRHLSGLWHTGSAYSEETCVENYRATGNPMKAPGE